MPVHAGIKGAEGSPTALANGLEQLFAVVMHQKIQCLGRESASKVEDSISYQVPFHINHASMAAMFLKADIFVQMTIRCECAQHPTSFRDTPCPLVASVPCSEACRELQVCMQVELKYPPASERPTQTAGQAQPLSFRPGELPKQAAKLPQWSPGQACAFSLAQELHACAFSHPVHCNISSSTCLPLLRSGSST